MTTRALFVCGSGHIFRAVRNMKNGRIRQCSVCGGVVTSSPRANMKSARKMVREILPEDPSYADLQTFAKGKIVRKPRSKNVSFDLFTSAENA